MPIERRRSVPVACERAYRLLAGSPLEGEIACAVHGMRVVANPSIPHAERTGRVDVGIGIVQCVGNEIGNLQVFWEETGDRTTWTRAVYPDFDVFCVD